MANSPHSESSDADAVVPDPALMAFMRETRDAFRQMRMEYEFAIDEVLTKVSILRREFLYMHRYNPIEHVGSRVKSTTSILEKALRKNLELTSEAIRAGITDIAGVRITCSFISDTYRILETLTSQSDVKVLEIQDYVAHPKPNGYKSVHALIEIPVFLTSGPVPVTVEVQIRTIAMDFWASLDHKIQYKYRGAVPEHLLESLTESAEIAASLDRRMEYLHDEVRGIETDDDPQEADAIDEQLLLDLWERSRTRPEQRGHGADSEQDATP